MIRLLVLVVATLLPAAFADAQDWAKAKLDKSPRHNEYQKLKHDKRKLDCFVVYPEVKEKATAVIVIHEIFGLTDWVRELSDELAEAGYIALAPDLLSGMGPKGGGTTAFDSEGVRKAIQSLPPDQITADLNAVAKAALELPACNGTIVVTGFCWGGGQSFRYATNNDKLKAAYVFYGQSPSASAELARIACPVYGFYAENDARINAGLPKTAELMKTAGKTFDPVTYKGGGHGFMRAGEAPDASEGNKEAREAAWKRWKELLKKA